jgi:hypothetical protein
MKLQVLAGALALGLGASAAGAAATRTCRRPRVSCVRTSGSVPVLDARIVRTNSYHSHTNSYRSYGSYSRPPQLVSGTAAYSSVPGTRLRLRGVRHTRRTLPTRTTTDRLRAVRLAARRRGGPAYRIRLPAPAQA